MEKMDGLTSNNNVKRLNYNTFRGDTMSDPPSGLTSCEDEQNEKSKFTLEQKLTLLSLMFGNLTMQASTSIIVPLFPQEALLKSVSVSLSGLAFSLFNVSFLVVAPLLPWVIHKIGPKRTMILGALIAGVNNVIFGFLGAIDSGTVFITIALIIRVLEGIGAAAFHVSSLTCVSSMFPKNTNANVGMVFAASQIGLSVGSPIGGLLYEVGGYGLPFYLLGGILIASVPLNYLLVPDALNKDTERDNTKHLPAQELLKVMPVLVLGIVFFARGIDWLSSMGTLSLQLQSFGLSPAYIGIFYFAMLMVYSCANPVSGYIADRIENVWVLMVSANVTAAIGLLILGPFPLLQIPSSIYTASIGVSIMAVSASAGYVPCYGAIVRLAKEAGFVDDLRLSSASSSIVWLFYSFSGVAGPEIGSVLTDKFDFATACSTIAGFSLVVALLAGVYFLHRKRVQTRGKDFHSTCPPSLTDFP